MFLSFDTISTYEHTCEEILHMFFESADKNLLINVYLKFREQKCFQDVTKIQIF